VSTLDKLFIALCEEYHPKILKYLYYAVGNTEDAMDLTQEVFVIVYKRIEELHNHENIGGFIYQTAKFQAANFKRKSVTKVLKEISDDIEIKGECKDLHEALIKEYDNNIDVNQYVKKVVLRLPEEKQRLYALHYVEKKSYKEISKLLKVNEASLRMKYVRLRREIKQLTHEVAKDKFVMDEHL